MTHGFHLMCGMNIDTLRLKNLVYYPTFWETEFTTLRGGDNTIFEMPLISDSGEDLS